MLVFRSPTLKKNLIWYEIESEKVEDYVMGVMELSALEFEITGATVDGKPGALKRLERFGLPVQMCHFHMLSIVTRYTTKRPRLPAAQELRQLTKLLGTSEKHQLLTHGIGK
ncbi:hypothetical protein K9N08_04710 [Candidatus Gracilibacteria bacterium]|nr:hypothetical protein [Candidatus Gracilibacteria bacterium]MCF7897085.1 hypothetical protein [Candidatus Gracilibacteria bacterium]